MKTQCLMNGFSDISSLPGNLKCHINLSSFKRTGTQNTEEFPMIIHWSLCTCLYTRKERQIGLNYS